MDLSDALTVLYRGRLVSCNYACDYCPFAKRVESKEEQVADAHALADFYEWVEARRRPTAVFFTPWGEALVRPWYRETFIALSKLPHVVKVAVQTNLHASVAFLEGADVTKVGLWCTYHPSQVSLERFVGRCEQLIRRRVSFSVGAVGRRDQLSAIEALRAALPPEVYVWINAYRPEVETHTEQERARMLAVDPRMQDNLHPHPSRGLACRTGHTVVTVDGVGDVRRCHFVPEVLGNIRDPGWERALGPRPCPNEACRCHIGYVHLEPLQLHQVYGEGLLERVPVRIGGPPPSATT
ncbi:MAG: radical SAM protein [Myxococcales bacterium]|nr:radical SAM protein [Myxococcales bacterium]MCB9647988.1 radical SAM protein [Deltaproteobacteria bacterium]